MIEFMIAGVELIFVKKLCHLQEPYSSMAKFELV